MNYIRITLSPSEIILNSFICLFKSNKGKYIGTYEYDLCLVQ